MTRKPAIKRVLGWKDRLDFSQWQMENIPFKVDTGARTSVLHVKALERIPGKRKRVRFIALDDSMAGYSGESIELPYHEERQIKNSFGVSENRYIIRTKIVLFGKTFDAEFSLRDRSGMEFPILLGRSFLRGRFLIDPARRDLSFRRKLRKLANPSS